MFLDQNSTAVGIMVSITSMTITTLNNKKEQHWRLVGWLWHHEGHLMLCESPEKHELIQQNVALTSGGTNSCDAWAANCKILVTSENITNPCTLQ